ncbi:unnamed protein product [Owenia fusiformis]|uniref:SMB domain-containing protein n=1 Tax=Owenia fusiformis TaxID=6347 RepID=A0A8S4P4Z3_OWEFU|nr:unnamed protein product [Owenia fusiformis]
MRNKRKKQSILPLTVLVVILFYLTHYAHVKHAQRSAVKSSRYRRSTDQVHDHIDIDDAEHDEKIDDLERDTPADSVDIERDTSTDPVDIERDTSTDQVDIESDTSTDQVDSERDTSTDPADIEHDTSTDPVDIERDTSTDQVDIESDTSTDQVDSERDTSADPADIERDTSTDPVEIERDTSTDRADDPEHIGKNQQLEPKCEATIVLPDPGNDTIIDAGESERDEIIDHLVPGRDTAIDQVAPESKKTIRSVNAERNVTIDQVESEYKTTIKPVDPEHETTIDSVYPEGETIVDSVYPERVITINPADREHETTIYSVDAEFAEVIDQDDSEQERTINPVDTERETTIDSVDAKRRITIDSVDAKRRITIDSVDAERDVAIDQFDPEHETTINPVHPERETTIDNVYAQHDLTFDLVDPEQERTINPNDPDRETTIDSVDHERYIATDQFDPDHKTTINRIEPGHETTDSVDAEYDVLIDQVDPEHETTSNPIDPESETTIDSVDPAGNVSDDEVTVSLLDNETVTGTINTPDNLTISTASLDDLNSCGYDISTYTCMENTCRGRCGQINNYTNALWLCSCDAACHVYGDCCKDFNDVCGNRTYSIEMEESFVCKNIGDGQYVYMKQSCRPDYNNVDIIQKCYGEDGVEGIIPVTDELTNVVYVNYFCAMCNRVNENVVPWKILVQCKMNTPQFPISGNDYFIRLVIMAQRSGRTCLISKAPKDEGLYMRRPCISISPTQCRNGCKDEGILEACKTGVRDPQTFKTGGMILRNAHCLQCLNLAESRDCDSYRMPNEGNKISNFFAYSVLVDVISDSGSVLQIKADSAIAGVDSAVKVKGAEISITKCPSRFKLIKNECVLHETQLKVFCRIPKGNNNAENIKARVTKAITEMFDIIGILFVKALPDGFVHCHFFAAFHNETLDWKTKFNLNEKTLQQSLPPVGSTSDERYCTYEKDGTELTLANLVLGQPPTEGQLSTLEISHSPSGNGRITSTGIRLCSGMLGLVSVWLVFAFTSSTIN